MKYKKLSIVISATLIAVLLMVVRNKDRQEEGSSYFNLINVSRRIRVEEPLIYDDFSNRYVFSGKLLDSAVIYDRNFILRPDVYRIPYSTNLHAPDTIFRSSFYSLYKLNNELYGDVFETQIQPILTRTVGDADEIDHIFYLYCTGYFDAKVFPKVSILTFLKMYDDSGIEPKMKTLELYMIMKNNMSNLKSAMSDTEDIINTHRNIRYDRPMLYLPYPIGCARYIFSANRLDTFEFDTRFCEKRNYYAVKYESGLPIENICNILAFDENGVLAEIKEEYTMSKYPFFLKKTEPRNGVWDKTYSSYVKDTRLFRLKTKFMSTGEEDCRWDEIRKLSNRVDSIPADYDSSIFVNSYDLILRYINDRNRHL